jgi:hypothetical protein
MKVTYTLSWEEYAELFEDSWPRTDYFSLIVTAMIAAPLIGYGITLAIFGAPDEKLSKHYFSPDQQAELASLLKGNVRQEECTPVKSPSL